jgi:hypothetical protein
VYIIFGNLGNQGTFGEIDMSYFENSTSSGVKFIGAGADDHLGCSVSGATGPVGGQGSIGGGGIGGGMGGGGGGPSGSNYYGEVLFAACGATYGNRTHSGLFYLYRGNDAMPASLDLAVWTGGPDGYRIAGPTPNGGADAVVSFAGDYNGDGVSDVVVGMSSMVAPAVGHVGAVYVLLGTTPPRTQLLDLALPLSTGQGIAMYDDGNFCGTAVGGGGDVNGDGFSDILVGCPEANGLDGEVRVLYGHAASNASIQLSAVGTPALPGYRILGRGGMMDSLGNSVCIIGDFNNDGLADIVAGAMTASSLTAASAGAAYVVLSNHVQPATSSPSQEPSRKPTALPTFKPMAAPTLPPQSIAPTTAAPTSLPTLATAQTDIHLDEFPAINANGICITDVQNQQFLGSSVRSAGDFNGDGIEDLIVGAYGTDGPDQTDAGAAMVLFGTMEPPPAQYVLADFEGGVRGFRIFGAFEGDIAGSAVSAIGDFNNDGFDDIAVSAPNASPPLRGHAGVVYVLFGHSNATMFPDVSLAQLSGGVGFAVFGEVEGGTFGASLSSAGDVNGDGYADFVVGAPQYSDAQQVRFECGAAYIILGNNGFEGEFADIDIATHHLQAPS